MNPPVRFTRRYEPQAMTSTTAFVFDLDDTLYAERSFAFSGFSAVAAAFEAHLGDPVGAAQDMRRLFDTGFRNRVFNTLLRERGRPEDAGLVRKMVETYRTHRPTISLYPDAESALSRLGQRYKLGLITDGPAIMQANKIDALDLRERFDAIILTDELGSEYGKPHPRAFELIANQLDCEPARCVYVADNARKDFPAPNTLGWITVQITREQGIYRDEPPAEGGTPRHVIATLDDLERLTQ